MSEVTGAYKIAMQIVLTDVFKSCGKLTQDDDEGDDINPPETPTQSYVRELIAIKTAKEVVSKM
jgi:hypothetical protein